MTITDFMVLGAFLVAVGVWVGFILYQLGKEKGCQSHSWVPGKIYCTHCGKEADYTGQELKVDTEY